MKFLIKYIEKKRKIKKHKEILNNIMIFNYHYENEDIIVDQSVNISGNNLESFPIKIKKINGFLQCSNNNFNSFKNFPEEILGDFYCENNNITSFEHFPKKIKNVCYLNNNPLNLETLIFLDNNFYCEKLYFDNYDKEYIFKMKNFFDNVLLEKTMLNKEYNKNNTISSKYKKL